MAKRATAELWKKLKFVAREFRHEPTPAENHLWQALRGRKLHGAKFRRQHTIERFIVDFYCEDYGLIIEVDGEIHQYTKQDDAIRQEYLEGLGLYVIRFTNEQVLKDRSQVLSTIAYWMDQPDKPHPPTPSPLRREGETDSD